ncbi:MAG: yhjE 2, partial [Microbacterium sp.]|nr:yhjE 2 [Microbacterium sp.]
MTTSASPTSIKPANPRSRVITASLIGTTIEFYDFYAYATAAVLVFPILFFPTGNDTTALLLSFSVFGAAMIARPIGAVVFGHFGDRFGRKATLVASLLTMFLLINFALPHPDGTAQRSEQFLAWGWRVPFLFSAVMVIVGLWVRLKLVESESFVKAEEKGAIRKFPLGAVIRRHWKSLILGTFIMLATYVLFYLMTNFTLSYGTKAADLSTASAAAEAAAEAAGKPFDPTAFAAQFYPGLGFGYTDFVIMQIIGVVFFGIFTLLSGPIADAIGRRRLLLWVTGSIIVFGLTFSVFLLPHSDPKFTGALTQAFLVLGFMLMGATFGPMGALLPELFPTNVRYTGSAISYNVSSILGAAVAPIIALWLWELGDGNPWLVGIYLSAMGLLTFIALLLSKETKDVDYDENIG